MGHEGARQCAGATPPHAGISPGIFTPCAFSRRKPVSAICECARALDDSTSQGPPVSISQELVIIDSSTCHLYICDIAFLIFSPFLGYAAHLQGL